MHSLLVASATLLCLIVHAPSAAAQTSALSCYTVPGYGASPKPWSTFYDATTSTKFQTIQAGFTTTITGAVPDSTITVHKKKWRTDYHDEYIETYTSTHWETWSETLARPTITITLPASFVIPADAPHASQDLAREKRAGEEEYYLEEYIGEIIRPEPEEKTTEVNTVICNTVFYTTVTRRKYSLSIVNQGQPKRTLTLTISHTEVVDEFATRPRTVETTTKTTTYRTMTTTFETVMPQISGVPISSEI